MARKTPPLSPSELKAFRHKIAELKKKGLISKTDARSAKPNWIRQGKRLDKWVADFDDVLSGKAAAIRVSDKQLRKYRKAGYETKSGAVIIPHSAGERASITRKGHVQIRDSKSGMKRIELPIPFHDLKQFVNDGIKQGAVLDSLKGSRPYWAYKFYGHNSYATYTNLDLLFEELSEGTASGLNLMDMARQETRKQQNEIYQNLTFFAVPSQSSWPRRDLSIRTAASAAARKRYRKRIKHTVVGQRARDRDAEAHRKWRERLTKSEKEKYNAKGRKRARKSNKKHPKRKHN